jgi:hypothetical protein
VVQRAATHVGIDQQHALAGLRHGHGEVRADEGLADARARRGDHQQVVLGLEAREVQARAQAAQRFHRKVGRRVEREQALATRWGSGRMQRELAAALAVRDRRVHRQPEQFDVAGSSTPRRIIWRSSTKPNISSAPSSVPPRPPGAASATPG